MSAFHVAQTITIHVTNHDHQEEMQNYRSSCLVKTGVSASLRVTRVLTGTGFHGLLMKRVLLVCWTILSRTGKNPQNQNHKFSQLILLPVQIILTKMCDYSSTVPPMHHSVTSWLNWSNARSAAPAADPTINQTHLYYLS